MSTSVLTPAERSRINGAKSRGPATAAGKKRSYQAHTKHGLYAAHGALLAHENREAYEALRQHTIAQIAPANACELLLVEEIVDATWLIARLRLAGTTDVNTRIHRLRANAAKPLRADEATSNAEIEGSSTNASLTVLERRIRALTASRSRILADLRLLRQNTPATGSTQDLLATKDFRVLTNPQNRETQPTFNPNQESNQ
jgi:hypothetical protein